jgi:hypothetical protein
VLAWLAEAVSPETVTGLPAWLLDGLGVGSLVMFIVVGLATSRLYTSRQVDQMIARYEKHLERTVALYEGRVQDATRREGEWRDVAMTFKAALEQMEGVIGPLQAESGTMLAILRQMQEFQREGHPRGR